MGLSIINYGEHNKVINNTDKTKQEIENNIFCVGDEVGTKSSGETVKTECRLGRENWQVLGFICFCPFFQFIVAYVAGT